MKPDPTAAPTRTKAATAFQLEADRNAQLNDLTDSQLADLLLEEVWAPMSSLTAAATIVGHACDRLKRSTAGPLLQVPAHGINCPKLVHPPNGAPRWCRWSLHGADDDTPYDVDGVAYCGRCHEALQ